MGLGGRLDATTCHPDRSVVGFGAIGLDHSEFLGATAAAIAAEKAGVMQPGCIAISARQSPEVAAVLEQRAEATGGQLRWVEPLDLKRWPIGIPGAVQASNGAVALGMLQALAEQGWPIGEAAIRTGLAQAQWPGRLQTLAWGAQTLLLDGAHNLPAAQVLRAELDRRWPQVGRHWVLGMLANKDAPAMLEALLAPSDQAWIVPVPGHASWSLETLQAACPQPHPNLHAAGDLEQALTQALAQAPVHALEQSKPASMPVVVAGSLYLIGHLLAAVATE